MARIRSIKPEFWTDEIIVQLPFAARLLFIGIWNFADDHGGLQDSAERIRMQIFPGDASIDVPELLELLVAAGLIERWMNDAGDYALKVRGWSKHQRVDNPGKTKVIGEGYRKLAIPSEARRAVAIKYGCEPGGRKSVTCFFCGLPGEVYWHRLASGKPSAWVCFPGLELDHAEPEAQGGASIGENLILSCRKCNRGRKDRPGIPFMTRGMVASPREDDTDSRGGREGRGRDLEGRGGERIGGEGKAPVPDAISTSNAGTEIVPGEDDPPEEPSPRRGDAAERRNGDFEAINAGVSKLLADGGYVSADTRGLARALHCSVRQVEVALEQLRDRGQLPARSAA